MNIADRILYLRKSKGISQEELADKVGVSRQAVSKWESEQSMPDVEKIIIMSDYFNVTTDYILKGIEVVENKEEKSKEIVGKVLYIASTALIVIGLLCAIGEWYEKQTMSSIYGSMIIQVVGVFEYFLAKVISKENSSFYVKWLNTIIIAFIPISMITSYISELIFKVGGGISPYPIGIFHSFVFLLVYLIVIMVSYAYLKRQIVLDSTASPYSETRGIISVGYKNHFIFVPEDLWNEEDEEDSEDEIADEEEFTKTSKKDKVETVEICKDLGNNFVLIKLF